jgi:hypothetical protein
VENSKGGNHCSHLGCNDPDAQIFSWLIAIYNLKAVELILGCGILKL